MVHRMLIVTAVQAEADAIGKPRDAHVVAGGIGRTNAAVATTSSILTDGPFSWIINAGVAGSLPQSELSLGDVVVANRCIYAEEGLHTPNGFQDMETMGFSLGNFVGNEVPVDPWMLEQLKQIGQVAPIATVATCSGSDDRAQVIRDRTGCVCEAMEGAAVVHAAQRLNTKAIEIRTISNSTGDRDSQQWDLALALNTLGRAVNEAVETLWGTP